MLTSGSQIRHGNYSVMNDMFQPAAAPAMEMPRLKGMEIWNGAKGLACVFRNQASECCLPATITWRGNWNLPIEPYVVQSWEAAALSRGQSKVKVISELLDADVVLKSHGDAIHHLELLHQVVSPVWLSQIRRESSLQITG